MFSDFSRFRQCSTSGAVTREPEKETREPEKLERRRKRQTVAHLQPYLK